MIAMSRARAAQTSSDCAVMLFVAADDQIIDLVRHRLAMERGHLVDAGPRSGLIARSIIESARRYCRLAGPAPVLGLNRDLSKYVTRQETAAPSSRLTTSTKALKRLTSHPPPRFAPKRETKLCVRVP